MATALTGCGSGGTGQKTSSTTTHAAATTTVPAERPKIDPKAIAFLNCESLVKESPWWACRRKGHAVYIIEGGTAKATYDAIKKHPEYNENSSYLEQSGSGFVFFPSDEGFEQMYETVGPRPGMSIVDTDLL